LPAVHAARGSGRPARARGAGRRRSRGGAALAAEAGARSDLAKAAAAARSPGPDRGRERAFGGGPGRVVDRELTHRVPVEYALAKPSTLKATTVTGWHCKRIFQPCPD